MNSDDLGAPGRMLLNQGTCRSEDGAQKRIQWHRIVTEIVTFQPRMPDRLRRATPRRETPNPRNLIARLMMTLGRVQTPLEEGQLRAPLMPPSRVRGEEEYNVLPDLNGGFKSKLWEPHPRPEARDGERCSSIILRHRNAADGRPRGAAAGYRLGVGHQGLR